MKEFKPKQIAKLLPLSAIFLISVSGSASIVYDNSAGSLNRSYSPGNGIEFGDEVFLAGTDRLVTEFRFETFVGATANNNQTAQVFFRLNNGTPLGSGRNAPGAVVASSPLFNLGSQVKGTSETHVWSGISVPILADNFTWSVVINGIDSGEQVGLSLYNPPSIGSSYSDFWQNSSGWNTFLIDGGAVNGNFSALITAVPIPEPSTVALGCLALLGLFVRFSSSNQKAWKKNSL